MNTKGNNLDEVTLKLVDAILADHILQRDKLIPRVRAILQAWVKVSDRPADYNNITTDKGRLLKTIEQRGVELDYYKSKLKDAIGNENMLPCYKELETILIEQGFKK